MERPRIKTKYPGVFYRERPDGSLQYIIWFQGTDGKGHFQNTPGGLKDAVKARARMVDRITQGHKVAPSRILFSEFARTWLDEKTNLSEKGRSTYTYQLERNLIPRLGRVKLSEVDVNRVAALVASMQKDKLKAWTIRGALTVLSGVMRTAARRGLAPTNPVSQLEKSERPQGDQAKMNILDSDEIRLLLQNAGAYRPLLATAIFTGLRLGELLSLRWEDVDWEEGVLHVGGTKTRAARREVVLMPALQQILAAHSLDNDGVFVFERGGRPIPRNTVAGGFDAAKRKAGIVKRVRFHDLRHTFASILISQGCDPAYGAQQMGHANISTFLNTYAKLMDAEQKREQARARMEAAFGEVLG